MSAIEDWLDAQGLSEYRQVFEENAIDLEVLPELTDGDLTGMGVKLGHRRKILKAVAAAQPETPPCAPDAAAPCTPPRRAESDAERRQLTVMFCDLAGSTALSQRLDPEDLRTLNRRYQDACRDAIERFEGFVARYMGDGVLAYFGYPRAHEDDAERAVHAGLAVLAAVAALSDDAERQRGVELAARVGIATGPTVVGDLVGEGASREHAAVGETPNLAARVQSLATVDTVRVSEATRRLLGERFECIDRGLAEVKGFAEPVRTWEIAAERALDSRFEATRSGALLPLVAREEERELLARRWAKACDGEGQVVLLGGEPGIGKSRLCVAARDLVGDTPHTWLRYQCSPYHASSAFHPVIAHLEHLSGFTVADSPGDRYRKLGEMLHLAVPDLGDDLPLVANLVGLGEDVVGDRIDPDPQRAKRLAMAALMRQFEGLCAQKPVLCVFEDAHWIDSSSLELLGDMVDAAERLPMLLLITFRPEFSPPWVGRAHTATVLLPRLSRRDSAAMVDAIQRTLPMDPTLVDAIVARTDGIPLFVEEMTRTVLDAGTRPAKRPAVDETAALRIPTTLQDSLMARLDSLPTGKPVAQVAAVIGREFGAELLAQTLEIPTPLLENALDELVDSGVVLRHNTSMGTGYRFKHALLRDAAYASLLREARREHHARVARVLAGTRDGTAPPEIVARHFSEAGLDEQAYPHWRDAAERAASRAAHAEAITHFEQALRALAATQGVDGRPTDQVRIRLGIAASMRIVDRVDDALTMLVDAERIAAEHGLERELAEINHLRGNLFFPLGNLKGCIEAHSRSLRHARAAGDPGLEARALGGIGDAHYASGRFGSATASFERCLSIARASDFQPIVAAYLPMSAYSAMLELDLERGVELAGEGRALAERFRLPRAQMVAHAMLGYALTDLGRLDEAEAVADHALALARQLGNLRFHAPFEINKARILAARDRREPALEHAKRALAAARQTNMAFVGPRALAVVAMLTDDAGERADALAEGEALLAGDVVAHNQIWFYRDAMEIALEREDWREARRYADDLERFMAEEPRPYTDFFVARCRALASAGAGERAAVTIDRLRGIRARAETAKLVLTLPRIDAAVAGLTASGTPD